MVFVALQNFLSNIGIGEFYSMMKDKFIYMALQKTSATKEPVSTLPHTPVSCIFFKFKRLLSLSLYLALQSNPAKNILILSVYMPKFMNKFSQIELSFKEHELQFLIARVKYCTT